MRQEGNPGLQPEIAHQIQYSLSYDFFISVTQLPL